MTLNTEHDVGKTEIWQDGTLSFSKDSWEAEGAAGLPEIPSPCQQKPLWVKGLASNKHGMEGQTRPWSSGRGWEQSDTFCSS